MNGSEGFLLKYEFYRIVCLTTNYYKLVSIRILHIYITLVLIFQQQLQSRGELFKMPSE